MNNKHKLVLIGSGIKTLSQLTEEAKTYIQHADVVLYLLNEPILEQYLQKLHPNTITLESHYFAQNDRRLAYQNISDFILSQTEIHSFVAVVLYGHPTVFANPGLAAIQKAKANGLEAMIIPGISAEDCLFADLAINPGSPGYYSIEATEFLLKKRMLDIHSHVVIWQIAMLASLTHAPNINNDTALSLLLDKLLQYYEPEHPVTLYEAAIYPGMQPKIQSFALKNLKEIAFSTLSTLYFPPAANAELDQAMQQALQ